MSRNLGISGTQQKNMNNIHIIRVETEKERLKEYFKKYNNG